MARDVLRLAARAAQVAVAAHVAYHGAVALAGWPAPPPAPAGARRSRFLVVVPAHDEERVLSGLLADLRAQDYPAAQVDVWVVADRCADATAEVARAGGAQVAERADGPAGKGPALRWLLARRPLDLGEALVVLDADNRVPPDLLARFDAELEAGHLVLQAYLDVVDPGTSPVAAASALTYWAGNRMVQLARRNLGWSADLGGTGMCLSAVALAAAGGFGDSPTEDQELAARLALAGVRVTWLHDLRVRDEKPADVGVAVRQRARWLAGKRVVARRYGPALLRAALARRSLAEADVALRLVQPGRSFVALVSGVLTLAGALAGRPWRGMAALTAVQVGLPLPFLAREGLPPRWLARYPLVTLIALLAVPARVLSRLRPQGWYHTPHGT